MNRRTFLGSALAALTSTLTAFAQEKKSPRILLRNAWQTVNIGDIAHPIGMLSLLEQHLPHAEIRLWPSSVDNGVADLLTKRFPKLTLLTTKDSIETAKQECDFLLHGSGSGFVAQRDTQTWHDQTQKPFGVYGISLPDPTPAAINLLSKSKFVFFRDSHSLNLAKEKGCTAPIMSFGPDSAFAVTDTRNDTAATQFLRAHNLEEGKFLCCIPRYRWTPYWTIKKDRPFDPKKHDRNQQMKDHDHAPLREAIIAVTRNTDLKVLVCPEDMTQIPLGKEILVDPLPDDVKRKVVWRDKYWLTDEALSTYTRSAGLFGNEMHSPILCIANHIPAIVCRFPEQTTKGYMWQDLGLGDWLFNLDNDQDLKRIPATVLEMAKDPPTAKRKGTQAHQTVQRLQRETMAILERSLT